MDNPIFFPTQHDFRMWLMAHHEQESELWVGYYKKASGIPSLNWSESVDEAICFGWIDGLRKSIDEVSYKIRFTPRKPKSVWSEVNLKKIEVLLKHGLMEPAGLRAFENRDIEKTNLYISVREKAQLPAEYENKLKQNEKAWEYFQALSPSVKKGSVWWIIQAKREVTRLKRLDILIQSCEQGEKIPPFRIAKK